jgi:hypothetical protein
MKAVEPTIWSEPVPHTGDVAGTGGGVVEE